jgi:hypothetical protein
MTNSFTQTATERLFSSRLRIGTYSQTATEQALSRATRIIKFWIPGAKFGRKGLIKYENGSIFQQKFYDYTLVLYAYSNLTLSLSTTMAEASQLQEI